MSETGPAVLRWDEIVKLLPDIDLVGEIEAGLVSYSKGECVVPPPGELILESPPGDVHIKYGYERSADSYVVKIASGFYQNPQRGLPSSDGMMLLFERATGRPLAVLLDEGKLTDMRTAAAGAVAARHLAPAEVERIGIVGAGIQARLQLERLRDVVECRRVLVGGRRVEALEAYRSEMEPLGFEIETTTTLDEVPASCQLIVTTTPAEAPLFGADRVRPGTHITAVGSDTPAKRELEAELLARADLVVADSLSQCRERGEISHALRAGVVDERRIVELGAIVADGRGRPKPESITIADLTGVAVQDARIAAVVYDRWSRR